MKDHGKLLNNAKMRVHQLEDKGLDFIEAIEKASHEFKVNKMRLKREMVEGTSMRSKKKHYERCKQKSHFNH